MDNYIHPLLVQLCAIPSKSKYEHMMIGFITKYCLGKGYTVVNDDNNLYVTKGVANVYPCMVAHTDTVHLPVPMKVFYMDDKLFAMNTDTCEQTGIGGDDKCGIWATLMLLESQPYMKAAFFKEEEIGRKGSKAADLSFFSDVGFILQCDRKGYGDFVNDIKGRRMYGPKFSAQIAFTLDKYGYKEVSGGYTDVEALQLPISMANISCGYYNPHKDTEYIQLGELWRTLDMCKDLFNDLEGATWGFEMGVDPPSATCPVHNRSLVKGYQGKYYCYNCKIYYNSPAKDTETIVYDH